MSQAMCFCYNYRLFLLVYTLTLRSQNSSPIQKGYPNEKSSQVFILYLIYLLICKKEGNFSGKKEKQKKQHRVHNTLPQIM